MRTALCLAFTAMAGAAQAQTPQTSWVREKDAEAIFIDALTKVRAIGSTPICPAFKALGLSGDHYKYRVSSWCQGEPVYDAGEWRVTLDTGTVQARNRSGKFVRHLDALSDPALPQPFPAPPGPLPTAMPEYTRARVTDVAEWLESIARAKVTISGSVHKMTETVYVMTPTPGVNAPSVFIHVGEISPAERAKWAACEDVRCPGRAFGHIVNRSFLGGMFIADALVKQDAPR